MLADLRKHTAQSTLGQRAGKPAVTCLAVTETESSSIRATSNCISRARTDVLGHSSHPEWQEHFEILVADEADDISFTVKDDNWIGQQLAQPSNTHPKEILLCLPVSNT